ncbi:hypothetical protein K7432_014662 [Basidiobolus ranarum]|uniref:C2H2-type domain-containing protein n=1 Tax=Basidiobolus ranarum TaxID=34480 RepID=A0ABR2VP67_9FUNG
MSTTTRASLRRKSIYITCFICQKTFNRKDNFIRHFRTHTGEHPHPCPHTHCGQGFTRSDQLLRHLNSKHPEITHTQAHVNNHSSAPTKVLVKSTSNRSFSFLHSQPNSILCSPMNIQNLVHEYCLPSEETSSMRLNFLLN